jgi:uncharacterized lipoprotein YajG
MDRKWGRSIENSGISIELKSFKNTDTHLCKPVPNHIKRQIMKNALLVFSTALLSFWLVGCAFTTERINLTYSPQLGVSTIPGANDVVVSVQVNDQRQEKSNKVSSKKNGLGMETAPILSTEDVTVTLRRAIEQELRSRGFSIGNEAIVLIIADLIQFWNDYKTGFFAGDAVADLNMSISIKNKNGNLLYFRLIIAQGVEPNTTLFTGNNARLALNRAIENGMKLLFEDQSFISALIEVAKNDHS